MPGVGIGPGLGVGGGAGWSETQIGRLVNASGLDDAGARAAIGRAASLALGSRAVGWLPTRASLPPVPVASDVAALPAGIVAHWYSASLFVLDDGAVVPSWTDAVSAIFAASTADRTTLNTYVANSDGLLAIRLSGEAVTVTAGSNAVASAISGSTYTAVTVAQNIQDSNADQTRLTRPSYRRRPAT